MQVSEAETQARRGLFTEGRGPILVLICAGIWLHAADMTMVTTIMPGAVAELGGVAWVAWAWMLELVGAIVAAACGGLLARRYGIARMLAVTAAIFALGCMVTAVSWDMAGFLAGRLLQGIGGGAMMALCNIGIATYFPDRLWMRAYAAVSLVWGISALVGPLAGGLFAEIGFWQGAFWLFAAQGVLVVVAAPALLRRAAAQDTKGESGVPVRSLMFLMPAVLMIGVAGVVQAWWISSAAVALGIALLTGCVVTDRRSDVTLLPGRSLDVPAVAAGLAMAFLLALSTVSFTTYGPLLLERLHGMSPLEFGYLAALESVAWSLAAMLIARWPIGETLCIRVGSATVVAGTALFAYAIPTGTLGLIVLAAVMQGGGFGLCWAYVMRRTVASARDGDRERTAGALPTVQMLGYAVGAAAVGIVANGLGFAETGNHTEIDRLVAETTAVWVFLAFLPIGLAGVAAGWRLARP